MSILLYWSWLGLVLALASAASAEPLPPRSSPDSLAQRLAGLPLDSSRILVLGQLANELQTTDNARSLRYGQQGLRLARRIHYKLGEVQLLYEVAGTYFAREDLTAAARYYQQVVRLARPVPRAQTLLTRALLGLGRVAVMQQDYREGQYYFYWALRRMPQRSGQQPPATAIVARNNLGVLYFDWLSSRRAYPDSVRQLALRYNRLALASLRQGHKGVDLAIGLNMMGNVHRLLHHPDSAAYYHRAALQLVARASSPYDLAQTQIWLGTDLTEQHQARQAVPLLRAALAIAQRLRLPALQADCSLALADALAATGRGNSAYYLAQRGHLVLDSIRQDEQAANLDRLRVQFDTEQAHGRVQELTYRTQLQELQVRQQRVYLGWVVSGALVVTLGLVAATLLGLRLRRRSRELALARAEQDRLYALIAHDLRSPVLTFTGLAGLLTTYVARQDTKRLLGLGGRVQQAAEGLRDLLDNLLHWALSQRGELHPVPQELAPATLMATIQQLYQPAAELAGVHLLLDVPPTPPGWADSQMTLTILRNLTSNALQATPSGGTVTLRVRTVLNEQGLTMEVADTGSGLSPHEVDRLNRGAGPAAGYRGRTGLGLRLSRTFAQAQGGELTLRSTPGQGTVATLYLPWAAAQGSSSGTF